MHAARPACTLRNSVTRDATRITYRTRSHLMKFGTACKAAAFITINALAVGVTATHDAYATGRWHGYSSGDSSATADLQHRLAMAGYDPGPMNGLMTSTTRQALIDFQRAHGLSANGRLDAK